MKSFKEYIEKPINIEKPTIALAKQLGATRFGWAGFKHNLMKAFGIPADKFDSWDVPQVWQDVFKKANGRR